MKDDVKEEGQQRFFPVNFISYSVIFVVEFIHTNDQYTSKTSRSRGRGIFDHTSAERKFLFFE